MFMQRSKAGNWKFKFEVLEIYNGGQIINIYLRVNRYRCLVSILNEQVSKKESIQTIKAVS